MKPLDLIKIEVWRQGFFPTTYQYKQRVKWMAEAWAYANGEAQRGITRPGIGNILDLGRMVEHEANMHGFRRANVQVQTREFGFKDIGVDWTMCMDSMARLLKFGDELTAEEFYREFEEIHPFEDGNGRTGKIIFNWMNNSLDDAIFPPDFFGGGVP